MFSIFRRSLQTNQPDQLVDTVHKLKELADMQRSTGSNCFDAVKSDKSLKRYATAVKVIKTLKTLCSFAFVSSFGLYLINQSQAIALPIQAETVLLPIAGVSLIGRFGLKIPQSLVNKVALARFNEIALPAMVGDLNIFFQ